jgi:hypothetical protein
MKTCELVTKFWNYFSNQEWEKAKELLDQDFIATWPQSRERILGPENFINVNRHYPGNHKIEIKQLFEIENKIITTVWMEADTGQKTFANSFFEIKNNKIISVTEYWAEPYVAPKWREKWVTNY